MHYEKTIRRIIAAVFVLICIAGIATSIGMNLVNRSLWLDEAALSYSFGKRSLLNLWDGQFEVNQIAPLGWLYCVKVITVFFGNTEFTLRIASVLFYALTIAALYYYVHHSLGCTGLTALAGAALYAGLPFILKYSNVFKPYIADGFFVLLVLIVFAAYRAKQIRMWQLCLIWCVLIWFSNPVVFVQAGCLLTELVSAVKRKDKGAFARLTAVGVIILFCFVVYYFFWLRSVAVGQEMQGYWEGDSFPLIPRSGNDLKRMIHSVLILFSGFSRDKWAMMIVSAAAGVHAIWKKKKEQLYVILATLTALAASSAHFFPISDRLWLFFIPLIAVFCMTGLEEYSVLAGERKLLKYGIGIVLPTILVAAGLGIPYYFGHPENVYWPTEELNDEIFYLQEHIQEDESVYVYNHSIYGWQYKMGYDNHDIGGYENNVLYGETFFEDGRDCREELEKITDRKKVYIATSHLTAERFFQLQRTLQKTGHLELISFEHETPLWFYCADPDDCMIHAAWEVLNSDGEETTIRVKNLGPAWINHDYESVRLVDEVSNAEAVLPKMIAPGQEIELTLACGKEPRPVLVNDEGSICAEGDFYHG